MADMPTLIARTRTELGDLAEDFVVPAMGGAPVIELGVRNIIPASVQIVVTDPGFPGAVVAADRYVLRERTGLITLLDIPTADAVVTVTGQHNPIWSDAELGRFTTDAVNQHVHNRETQTRYKDEHGHIRYERHQATLADLPDVEIVPVACLAAIEALWAAATDAATDIDVVTSEGTHIARGQRYDQIITHIGRLTSRYKEVCAQLGVGLYRLEIGVLRRVSLTTGRLIPVFTPREYDEWDLPRRRLPPIDSPNEDESGIPSPVYGAWGF